MPQVIRGAWSQLVTGLSCTGQAHTLIDLGLALRGASVSAGVQEWYRATASYKLAVVALENKLKQHDWQQTDWKSVLQEDLSTKQYIRTARISFSCVTGDPRMEQCQLMSGPDKMRAWQIVCISNCL